MTSPVQTADAVGWAGCSSCCAHKKLWPPCCFFTPSHLLAAAAAVCPDLTVLLATANLPTTFTYNLVTTCSIEKICGSSRTSIIIGSTSGYPWSGRSCGLVRLSLGSNRKMNGLTHEMVSHTLGTAHYLASPRETQIRVSGREDCVHI